MKELSNALAKYLKTIYNLSAKSPAVRITDVAHTLGISKPSANRAVNMLKHLGLVLHEPYEDIYLTDEGRQKAEKLFSRHFHIKCFLVTALNIDEKTAETEAASIEHSLSAATVEKMVTYTVAQAV